MLQKTLLADIKTIHKFSALIVVLIITGIGIYALTGSHAASPYASVNASSGSLLGGVQSVQNCNGASGGSCVDFSQPIPTDGNVALALASPGTPFAASSFWNTPLPASTAVNPNTSAYISDINAALCLNPKQTSPSNPCLVPNYGTVNISCYSGPLYVVPANQPLVPLILDTTASSTVDKSLIAALQSPGVPIPADAHAAGGSDGEIQIYQPSTDRYWEFWRFSTPADNAPTAGDLPWSVVDPACNKSVPTPPVPSYGDSQYHASWGGEIPGIASVTNGVPTYSPSVSQSNGVPPNNTGATATSLPLLGGVVRIEELQAGQIDHVMGLQLANNLSKSVIPANTPGATNGISWPATRTDGTNTSDTAIPEGLRFRLPPECTTPAVSPCITLSNYDLTPLAKTIAVAAQKYGFVVYDTDPNGLNIRLGDPTAYTAAGLPNPYTTGPGVGGVSNGNKGLLGSSSQSDIMENFPWDQLEALPFNYGEPN